MFRKQISKKFTSMAENIQEYHHDYASVTQFVKKNKVIPQKMVEFQTSKDHQNKIDTLFMAILKGDLKNSIFSNPNCQLYALYLLKEKTIDIDTFLSVNIYLIVLMQFTQHQTLRNEHQKYKRKAEIKIFNINNLDIQNKFINRLFDKYFTTSDEQFDGNAFTRSIQQLSKLDQCVIGIHIPNFDIIPNSDTVLTGLKSFIIGSEWIAQDDYYVYLPLTGLIKTLIQTHNADLTINPAPIFGNINFYTLFLFHQLGLHPIDIYMPYVATNIVNVHDMDSGPLFALLHDLIHLWTGNLLQKNHFLFIFEYLIPLSAEKFQFNLDTKFDEQISGNIFNLIDIDFSIEGNKNEIFYNCFNSIFNINKTISNRSSYLTIKEAILLKLEADQEKIQGMFQVDINDLILKTNNKATLEAAKEKIKNNDPEKPEIRPRAKSFP